jgi:hypothetical protein
MIDPEPTDFIIICRTHGFNCHKKEVMKHFVINDSDTSIAFDIDPTIYVDMHVWMYTKKIQGERSCAHWWVLWRFACDLHITKFKNYIIQIIGNHLRSPTISLGVITFFMNKAMEFKDGDIAILAIHAFVDYWVRIDKYTCPIKLSNIISGDISHCCEHKPGPCIIVNCCKHRISEPGWMKKAKVDIHLHMLDIFNSVDQVIQVNIMRIIIAQI